MTLTRRHMLSASAGFVLAGAAGALLAPPWRLAKADAGQADPADLAKTGPDGDIVLGSDKAPVTIIEYASMTCPHCAAFNENVLYWYLALDRGIYWPYELCGIVLTLLLVALLVLIVRKEEARIRSERASGTTSPSGAARRA